MRRLVVVALLLLLAACGCSAVTYQAPVLRDFLGGKAGVTLCGENNLPYIVIDAAAPETVMGLSYEVHEQKHVTDMRAYRGGCKPFVLRYRADSSFRRRAEWAAYCEQGRWLIAHNADPEVVWEYLRESMRESHGETVFKNCLYEDTR